MGTSLGSGEGPIGCFAPPRRQAVLLAQSSRAPSRSPLPLHPSLPLRPFLPLRFEEEERGRKRTQRKRRGQEERKGRGRQKPPRPGRDGRKQHRGPWWRAPAIGSTRTDP